VVSGVMANGRQPLPRATPLDTRQRFFIFYYKKYLPSVSNLAPGKDFFAGSQIKLPANYFFYFFVFWIYFLVGT
jgi:hypothetical protein